ncbi:MAG: dienelactone hydrolase family protein [Mycobacterium sp.]
MTPLQRYIAEEIATDHVDGLLSRREAIRRLGLLGVSAAGASALIAACGGEGTTPTASSSETATSPATSTSPPAAPTTPAEPPPGAAEARPTAPITWAGPAGDLQGAWAEATAPRGGVLVIHENKGLNDWTRSVAGRLAGIGYSSLAIDLLSANGGTATFADPAEATAALGNIAPEVLIADLKSGLAEVQQRLPGQKIAAVGFCMGGGLVWRLLDSGVPELAAAVPFYGPTPDDPDFAGSAQAAVLAFYGALDARVNATEQAARTALEQADMVHDIVIEDGADHAFFNDTGQRYNPVAALDAWTRMSDWFDAHLAPS